MGGPLLKAAGADVLVDHRQLSVVGLSEVAAHFKVIYRAWRTITHYLSEHSPSVVVLIDFPDFNLLLARVAKRRGIKVFYYISPQVWAWRSGRVRAIRRLVDEMAVILPFETEFYARHRMQVRFVGHPLLDVLANQPPLDEVKRRYRPSPSNRLVGLLPGSRQSEIRALLPTLLDCTALLQRRVPDVAFIIPVAPSLDIGSLEAVIAARGLALRLVSGDTYGVIRACDLLLTVSGTATLEAAILGTPMIITNRVSDLSYQLGHRLIKVAWIGLPNLIAGRRIVPEYVQHAAQPDLIADEATTLLQHPERLQEQRRELGFIRTRLGEPGVADRVAGLVLGMSDFGCRKSDMEGRYPPVRSEICPVTGVD
jgi:lipid-A-disaccharide synthase